MAVAPVGPLEVANALGLVAFAAAGTLKGADADLDFFGVVVLGILTSFGGGALRDVLVGRTPTSLLTTNDIAFAFVGVALALLLSPRVSGRLRDHPLFRGVDAVGLATFAATGALVGVAAGVSGFGVVVLATLTGVGGGSLSDLLLTRVPVVLREDFYATPAALGGVVFYTSHAVAPPPIPTTACVVVVLATRLLALRYDWGLPGL
ncbi:trimeric intracellular cation channel family protein [Halorarius litoreus]|uniref:trimeric intracellular cation channel family protein n=1 Tax=Halorarius litoreus TaxID=2962676 RepID=UPI0020CD2CAC|nr:trimeric intracellular cation channel family protein [Halorarius litoreus]